MLFDSGKLEKLTIQAYLPQSNSDKPSQTSDNPEDIYTVQVNPSTYTLNQAIEYSCQQGQGDTGSEAVYRKSAPITLQFDFLFDGTGVIPPQSNLSEIPLVGAIASALSEKKELNVTERIKKFNKLVYEADPESHRPRKLLLTWGDFFRFPCVLTSLSYRFTLFNPDGTPLRVIASCSFQESKSDTERSLADAFSSPDLTHLREVKEGDTLPLMSYRIYGKTDLYIEIARVNKLINFRRLQAGSQLAFPPVDKEAKK
ncbi:MAG: hypothetical protein AB4040_16485 [Synechococcus sp.]